MAVCAEADRSRDINSAILHFDGPGPSFGQRVLCLRRLVSEAGIAIDCGQAIDTAFIHADGAT